MDTAESLAQKINKKIKNNSYLYISNEIEHGLGIYGLIDNVKYICLNDADTVDYLNSSGINTYCHQRNEGKDDQVKTSAQLIELLARNDGFKIQKNNLIQTFKVSKSFAEKVNIDEAISLNTSTELNQLFENKLTQVQIFRGANLTTPNRILSKLEDLEYSKISEIFDGDFVIQFNRGHTGSGTLFVKNSNQLKKLIAKFPEREVIVSEYVKGETYTINCCQTKVGLLYGGLSRQITGITELTKDKGATVGNDFAHSLSDQTQAQLQFELGKLEFVLKKYKFKGLFGIDFIVDKDTDSIKIIEMNARQPMSTVFHSRIQLVNGQIPLSLLHIAEYLDIDFKINTADYNKSNLQPIQAGQLYLRNAASKDHLIKSDIRTGEYAENEKAQLIFKKRAFLIDQIEMTEKKNVLLITQKKGNSIKSGREIARVQVMDSIYESKGNGKEKLKQKYLSILKVVKAMEK